jgi:hypothetical protein
MSGGSANQVVMVEMRRPAPRRVYLVGLRDDVTSRFSLVKHAITTLQLLISLGLLELVGDSSSAPVAP